MKKNSNMTLTRTAAARLEKQIYAGVYPPDSPLPSTRKLAGDFQVSQRIILLALDILEKKNILVRQERKRVYVKARSFADDAREILFFAFGDHLEEHGIYQTVNGMILQEWKQYKYDFFSRVISSSDALTETRLDYELARLENLGFIDCALVYCFMNEQRMKKFLKLPYPVIFIGELPDGGILPPGARLISPNSSELLLTAARHALQENHSCLALAYWKRPTLHLYEKTAMRELTRFAAEHGLALELFPVEGNNIDEVCGNFESKADGIAAALPPGALMCAYNLHSVRFDSGELLNPENYPGVDFLTLSLPHDACRIKYVKRNLTVMRQTIIKEIENPGTERHITVDYQYSIINPDNRMKGSK